MSPLAGVVAGAVPGTGTQPVGWGVLAAPLTVVCTAVVVLLVDAFAGEGGSRRRRLLPAWLSLAGLAVAGGLVLAVPGGTRATFCLVGGSPCSLVADPLTLAFWAVVLAGTFVVVLIGTGTVADRAVPTGEWHFLLLCSAAGALVLAGARDLVTLVVALEVVSLPVFALVALRRGDPAAAGASVKFFLVSVVSTAVTLMGVSLLYGATGSVFLDQVGRALAHGSEVHGVAVVGTLLTVVGLAFKVAAVPFHMWVPETYTGAPVAVAAYLSVVSKSAGFVGLLLVLTRAMPSLADAWAPVVGVLAALTMTVGNVMALRQRHAVRLLAWSSVAQAGYILVPFAAASRAGTDPLGASVGYLAVYAVLNLGAFAVAALVGTRHPAQRLGDYRGLVAQRPVAGWGLGFALVSLAGLPPGVVGLFAKVAVFGAVAGPVTWLAVVMVLNVAVGLVYYVRWLLELFRPAATTVGYDVPPLLDVAVAVTFGAGVVFSVVPGLLLDPTLAVLS